MNFAILRGTKEIGGTCVRISTKDSSIVIDAGLPLHDWRDDRLEPNPKRGFPATDRRALKYAGLFQPGPAVHGLLLSHAHADHCGLVCQTDPSIKVYASKGTSKMMAAGSIFAHQTELDRARWVELESQVPVQIGGFKVTPFNVDHSAFDAMAFLIEADGKRLLYTGDFRLHGRKPGMAEALAKKAGDPRLDVMLLEGTHVSSGPERNQIRLTEEQLQSDVQDHIRKQNGLILTSFSPQNVDRLVTFYKAARECRRVFVTDIYTAYVLHVVHGQCRSIPRPQADAGIYVYYNKGFTGKSNWKAVVRKFDHSPIELAEILKSPRSFVMVFRPSMLDLDFGGQLPATSSLIYSFWHGYLERPEWKSFRSVLDRQGCSFAEYHTSGHVFVEDCQKLIEQNRPACIVPVHTTAPQEFPRLFPNVRLLKDGEEMTL